MATKTNLSKDLDNLRVNTEASRNSWESVMRQGVVASLHIGRPRFEQGLDLEDLGFRSRKPKEREAIAKQVRTGRKLLLPPEYEKAFLSIETSARHTLSRNANDAGQGRIFAFATPFGSFVPVTAYAEWRERVDGYKQRYMEKRDELLGDFENIQKRVLSDYYTIATGAYERLRRYDPTAVADISAATFVRRYRERIRAGWPTKEVAAESFYFDITLSLITLPEDLREKVATSAIMNEQERVRIRQLQQVKNDVAKSTLSHIRDFTATVDEQLYRLVYAVAEDAHKAVSKNTTMRSKTLTQLRNLVQQIQMLNFADHTDLADIVERIDESVSSYVTRINKTEARQHLIGVLDATRIAADRRLRDIGDHRKVRRELTLDGTTKYELVRRERKGTVEAEREVPPLLTPTRRQKRTVVE